jgi:hypothetical protein
MSCAQKLCAKISDHEWVILNEDFGGRWSFLIWGSDLAEGYIGPSSETDAKATLDAVRASLAASGRERESDALHDLNWQVAVQHIANQGIIDSGEIQRCNVRSAPRAYRVHSHTVYAERRGTGIPAQSQA